MDINIKFEDDTVFYNLNSQFKESQKLLKDNGSKESDFDLILKKLRDNSNIYIVNDSDCTYLARKNNVVGNGLFFRTIRFSLNINDEVLAEGLNFFNKEKGFYFIRKVKKISFTDETYYDIELYHIEGQDFLTQYQRELYKSFKRSFTIAYYVN